MQILSKLRIPFKKIILFGFWPSIIKKLLYRAIGHKIGKNFKIGFGSIILTKQLHLGHNVTIAPFTVLQATKISIDDGSTIGSFCYFDLKELKIGSKTRIRESVMVGGNKSPDSTLDIGDNCLLLQNTLLNITDKISIGNNTGIGGGSKLFTHSSWLSVLDGYPVIQGKITIGNNVWIPYDTTILSNVTIGDHVIIMPRTVVNRDIPSFSLAGGQPFKIVKNGYYRKLSTERIGQVLEKISLQLSEFLQEDGFLLNTDHAEAKLFVCGNQSMVFVKDFETINKLPTQLFKKHKRCAVFITRPCMNRPIPSGLSLIYIFENKPEVHHPNKLTDMVLLFLSRYGIR